MTTRTIRLNRRSTILASLVLFSGTAAAQDKKPEPPKHTLTQDNQSRRVDTWAKPGSMRNPVSFTIDWKGSVYVAETDRAGNAVTDTRGLGKLNAVEEDLKLKSVEDRRALINKWIAAGAFEKDFFTRTEDRVRVLRDTDGDGVADFSGIFAGGFNDALDGIGAGVLFLNGSIYYTCIPSLWKLTDTNNDFAADTRENLSTGYGIRWCFFGHDLHGLALGPDGRIYFSMGDRGYNVTTREGVNLLGPDRGGVFRCWPDGSELEVFHEALRNPQELAFDDLGELFTGDNNCDSGDAARMVHVWEGGNSGWCQDVQSLESRGPWNREFIWNLLSQHQEPARPAWATPPIDHIGAGPSGMLHYPGLGESDRYTNAIFMVDYYGSGATVHAFKPVADGATFKTSDKHAYYSGVTVTDIAYGYDGRMYLSDWGGGWEPNPNGNIFTISNTTALNDPSQADAIAQVRELFNTGFSQRAPDELMQLLAHRDQRVRLAAQYELATRGDPAAAGLAELADSKNAPFFQRLHSIWALGQIARKSPKVAASIAPLMSDADAEIRAQALRTLGDLKYDALMEYSSALSDESPRVRYYAALAVGKCKDQSGIGPLLDLLAANDNKDRAIRNAAVYALTLIGKPDDVITAAAGMPAAVRLGVVLSLRRSANIGAAAFLADEDPVVAIEAARAVYDMNIAAGLPALARMLDQPIAKDRAIEPLTRRVIEANAIVGDDAAVERLARFATDANADPAWRLLALEKLENWDKPLKRDGVWGHWIDLPARSADPLRAALARHQVAIADAASTPELKAKSDALSARIATNLSPEEMLSQLADAGRSESYRAVILEQIASGAKEQLPKAAAALLDTIDTSTPALRMRARELLAAADAAMGADKASAGANAADMHERQHAIKLLGSIDHASALVAIGELAMRLSDGKADPSVALEIYEAAMHAKATGLRAMVEKAGFSAKRPPGFSTTLLLKGGDPARGKGVFLHHEAAQCVRCHTIGNIGGTAGPNLSLVASRATPEQLVESVTEPNAVIVQGFGQTSAMPEMTQMLQPSDVRDLVAYLSTLYDPSIGPADSAKAVASSSGLGAPIASSGPWAGPSKPGPTKAPFFDPVLSDDVIPALGLLALLIPLAIIAGAIALAKKSGGSL
ncbi:MAG: HEAT repeat domain-containing protein [Phycisphaerales bacterium]|nr:HEAT repeat domain-containing protein [Phycisphaerales bacterium]